MQMPVVLVLTHDSSDSFAKQIWQEQVQRGDSIARTDCFDPFLKWCYLQMLIQQESKKGYARYFQLLQFMLNTDTLPRRKLRFVVMICSLQVLAFGLRLEPLVVPSQPRPCLALPDHSLYREP